MAIRNKSSFSLKKILFLFLSLFLLPNTIYAFEFSIENHSDDKQYAVGAKITLNYSFTEKELKDITGVNFIIFDSKSKDTQTGRTVGVIDSTTKKGNETITLPKREGVFELRAIDKNDRVLATAPIITKQVPTPGVIELVEHKGRQVLAGQKLSFKIKHDFNRTYYGGVFNFGPEVTTFLAILPVDFKGPNWNVPDYYKGYIHAKNIGVRWGGLSEINDGKSVVELTMPNEPGEYAAFLITRSSRHLLEDAKKGPIELEPFILDSLSLHVNPISVERIYATLVNNKKELTEKDYVTEDKFYIWVKFEEDHPGFSEKLQVSSDGIDEPITLQTQGVEGKPKLHRTLVPKKLLFGKEIGPSSADTDAFGSRDTENFCSLISNPESWSAPKESAYKALTGFVKAEPLLFPVSEFAYDSKFYNNQEDFITEYNWILTLKAEAKKTILTYLKKVEDARSNLLTLQLQALDKRAAYIAHVVPEDLSPSSSQYAEQKYYEDLKRADWVKAQKAFEEAHSAYIYGTMMAAAHIRRAQLFEIKRLRSLTQYFLQVQPRHMDRIMIIQGGDIKYCARWLPNEQLRERLKEQEDALDRIAELEEILDHSVQVQRLIVKDFIRADKKMQDLNAKYIRTFSNEQYANILVDLGTSATSLETSGWVGLIAEGAYQGYRIGDYLINGATESNGYEKRFPRLQNEIASAIYLARNEASTILDREFEMAEGTVLLHNSTTNAAWASFGVDSQKTLEAARAAQDEINKLPTIKGVLFDDLSIWNDSIETAFRLKDSASIQEAATVLLDVTVPTTIEEVNPYSPSNLKNAKYLFQPPGGLRLIQVGNINESRFQRAISSPIKITNYSPREAWDYVTGNSVTKLGKAYGWSVARGALIKKGSEIIKEASREALGDSREVYEDYVRTEVEWFALRRHMMIHKEILEKIYEAYINDVSGLIDWYFTRPAINQYALARWLDVLINLPLSPKEEISTEAYLNGFGFLANPFLDSTSDSKFDKQASASGADIRDIRHIRQIQVSESLPAQRLTYPVANELEANEDNTWTWTLDTNPTSPANYFDPETFRWGGNTNQKVADDFNYVYFKIDVNFELREKGTTVEVIH